MESGIAVKPLLLAKVRGGRVYPDKCVLVAGRVATEAAWLKGRNSHGEREEQNILTGKEKKKNILDTHRPSHGRH